MKPASAQTVALLRDWFEAWRDVFDHVDQIGELIGEPERLRVAIDVPFEVHTKQLAAQLGCRQWTGLRDHDNDLSWFYYGMRFDGKVTAQLFGVKKDIVIDSIEKFAAFIEASAHPKPKPKLKAVK